MECLLWSTCLASRLAEARCGRGVIVFPPCWFTAASCVLTRCDVPHDPPRPFSFFLLPPWWSSSLLRKEEGAGGLILRALRHRLLGVED